jgi:phage terminase large subunit-like protein
LKRLDLSPEVGWFLRSRGIKLPTAPPRWKTPEPRTARGARFDPARVDRVLKAFSLLRHTKGQWAGKPLTPDPWQVAYIIAPVFGWVRWDADADAYVRIINQLYVEVPRKNGKTTLVGGIGIYLTCADGEKGAEVIAAATTEKQARLVFDPVRQLAIKGDPRLTEFVKPMQGRIVHPRSGSYMEPVASVAEALHGGNLHGALVDELHVHKSAALVETIETGTGSRTQPLLVMITTADDGRSGTIYARKRDYVEKLARRTLKDASTYGVIWCASDGDDPFSEATWKKANPGYGTSPTRAYLQRAATSAKNSPAERASFLRLHLGLRTKQETRYIELPTWDRNAGMVDEAALRGDECYGGLDLAATSDLCALCWTFPHPDGSYDVLWRHWVPEAAFRALNERTAGAAQVWRNEGWLHVTPGDVADYDYIREQINRDRERFDVQAIGYDRWNASQLVNDLVNDEAPMVQMGQGYASMSAPLKQVKHLLLEGTADAPRYRHGGNPLMRWQTDNLAVAMDAAGNVKPDKSKAGDKIDGWSAAVDAMGMALAADPPTRSAYEDDDLMVV